MSYNSEINKKILVVDDEKLLADALKEKLGSNGYEVTIAYDGHEALDKINADKPDLILLDLYMPVMGGKEVLKNIKENETTKNIPVVILSNLTMDPNNVAEILEMGVKDYIGKADYTLEKITDLVNEKLQNDNPDVSPTSS